MRSDFKNIGKIISIYKLVLSPKKGGVPTLCIINWSCKLSWISWCITPRRIEWSHLLVLFVHNAERIALYELICSPKYLLSHSHSFCMVVPWLVRKHFREFGVIPKAALWRIEGYARTTQQDWQEVTLFLLAVLCKDEEISDVYLRQNREMQEIFFKSRGIRGKRSFVAKISRSAKHH